MRCSPFVFASLFVSLISSGSASAQQPQTLRYSVVFSDSSGVTHFRDEEVPWQARQSSDPRTSILVTPLLDAEKIGFVRLNVSYSSDWHPAPGKRFVMTLGGEAEIEVGDGQRRTFGPGSVVLVTDVTGRGHRTRVLSKEEVFLVWVPVP